LNERTKKISAILAFLLFLLDKHLSCGVNRQHTAEGIVTKIYYKFLRKGQVMHTERSKKQPRNNVTKRIVWFLIVMCAVSCGSAWAELKAYDDFIGNLIDQTLWYIDNPDNVLLQSDGLLSAVAPPLLSEGKICSKIDFYGDLEVILDWRGFSVSVPDYLTAYHSFRLCVQDSINGGNSANIERGYGSSPEDWITSWIWQNLVVIDSSDSLDSAASGLFKITRVGSKISVYYDTGGGWIEGASADVFSTAPLCFWIYGRTADVGTFQVSSDWISVDGQVMVPLVLGMSEAEAESALNRSGVLKGAVTHDYSDTVPADAVMDQNPSDGTLADFRSEVDLVISQGPEDGDGDGCTPPDAELLHPVSVGLRFVYNRVDGDGQTSWTVEREFVEKMTSDSMDYYLLRSWNYDNDAQYEAGPYARTTHDAVYSYNPPGDNVEFRAAPVGTTWTVPEPDGAYIQKVLEVVAIDEVTVPYGTFCAYKHRTYKSDGNGLVSPSWYEWVVPGVGVVKEEDHWASDGQTAPLIMELTAIIRDPVTSAFDIVSDTITQRTKSITCHIHLSQGLAAEDIKPENILLSLDAVSIPPSRTSVRRKQNMLVAVFPTSELWLQPRTEPYTLTVTGELTDGTLFEGSDDITVISKGRK
jgi:hypothetical protein